jgi:hypothetical protein
MEGDNFIVKSKYDNKNYRVINMENGLQALLVHDPSVATKGGPKKKGNKQKWYNIFNFLLFFTLYLFLFILFCFFQSSAAAMIVGVGVIYAQKYSHGLPHLLGSYNITLKKNSLIIYHYETNMSIGCRAYDWRWE